MGSKDMETVSQIVQVNGKEYVEHQVPHWRQRYNWDCGVTCVMMMISDEQRKHLLDNFTHICEEEGFGQFTWTIDLCYLLKRFDIKHRMYTTMMGVNEEYRRHGYYDKIIDVDRSRIQARFDQASTHHVEVSSGALSPEALEAHLGRGPAIVLVDGGLLSCDLCKHNKMRAELRRCFGGSYRGHYIVVVGFLRDARPASPGARGAPGSPGVRGARGSPGARSVRGARGARILFRDPARPHPMCATTAAALHRAREASGTDHDVILVYKDFR